jgi:hypothetical protein
LQLQEAAGDRFGVGRTLNGLGIDALGRRQFLRAMNYFDKSLSVSRELNDPASVATELGNMATLAYEQGDLERARSLAIESLTMRRDLGGRFSI